MEANQTALNIDSLEYAKPWNPGQLFLKIFVSVVLVVGIIGNTLCGIIMGGNKANRLTTRLLMVILAVADTAVLLTGALRYWTMVILDWDPRNDGPISCKAHLFAVAFSTDFAVGSLCALAVERLLVVAFPHRANNVVTVTSVILGMTIFAFVVAMKSSIHFWMMGLNKPISPGENRTGLESNSSTQETPQTLQCGLHPAYSTVFRVFIKIDMINFAVLPYVILFSSNVYIYVKLRKQQKVLKRTKQTAKGNPILPSRVSTQPQPPTFTERSLIGRSELATGLTSTQPVARRVKRRPESAIKLLTALTLIHVFCTLPGTTFTFLNSYFPDFFNHIDKETHDIIKGSLVTLLFTNNAINFFGYYASCVSFRESFRNLMLRLFLCGRRKRQGDSKDPSTRRSILQCCRNTHSSQPDRVLIVAPKPCTATNGEHINNCVTTAMTTEPIAD